MEVDGKIPRKWHRSNFPGVRYREHPTRKHGVQRDKYFTLRAKVRGVLTEEGLGWASEGWTAAKAAQVLSDLKKAHTLGEGPVSLAEKRDQAEKDRARKEAEDAKNITFAQAADKFVEWGKQAKKDWSHDQARLSAHVLPVIGAMLLPDIGGRHVEEVYAACRGKNLSTATIHHCLQLVRAVYNHAARMGYFSGVNPTKNIKFPRLDNKRMSFFSYAQAEALLAQLAERDLNVHNITLLSLFTGLRFSEIARLRWEHVDRENNIIHVVDAKGGESRQAFITERIKGMFDRRFAEAKPDMPLVFPSANGKVRKDISDIFTKTLDELGLNRGVTDPRQKLCFHSCRHTFGSWLAVQGEPLVAIKELMGHKVIEMTLRYAHLMPDVKRKAVEKLGQRVTGKVLPLVVNKTA